MRMAVRLALRVTDEEGVEPQEEMEQTADVGEVLFVSSDEEADGVAGEPSGVAGGQRKEGEGDSAEEGEDEYEGGGIDSSDEEDDTSGSVADNIGHAVAPEGWQIVNEPPALGTEQELQQLIGKNSSLQQLIGTTASKDRAGSSARCSPAM